MAKNETAAPVGDQSEEWDDIRVGLGEEWDFRDGPLVGNFLGTTTQEIEDKQTREQRTVNVHQFAPVDNPDVIVFLWGSSELDAAMASDLVRQGDKMRITFLGIDQFTSDDGPRQIKRYRVQAAKRV